VSYAEGDLFVAGYNSAIGTPAALYEITNAPVPGAITQLPPTTGSAAAGTAFTSQLVTAGQSGIVTFTTGQCTTGLSVSASGAVSAPSTLTAGPYTCTGTDEDTFANAGTWMFTLTVSSSGPPPVVPESPLVIGLPLAALLLGGAAFWMNRRRRRPALGGQA
jgi:hypothetical protein